MGARFFGVLVASTALVGGVLLPAEVATSVAAVSQSSASGAEESTALSEPPPAEVEDDADMATPPPPLMRPGSFGPFIEEPETVHFNGAALTWGGYADRPTSTADDAAEYQIYRACVELPVAGPGNGCSNPAGPSLSLGVGSSAELVGATAPDVREWTDMTAVSSTTEDPATYRYWVVVRTVHDVANGRNGYQASASVMVTTPTAGRTRQVLNLVSEDATISNGITQPKPSGDLQIGPGQVRSVIKFATTSLPQNTIVLSGSVRADVRAYGLSGTPEIRLEELTGGFSESYVTWTQATSNKRWSTPGGDVGLRGATTRLQATQPRLTWAGEGLTNLAQSWISNPASNLGVRLRLVNEGPPPPNTVADQVRLESSEAIYRSVRPVLIVEHASTAASTVFDAPEMPERWVPGATVTVPVRVLNTSTAAWPGTMELGYRWGATGAFSAATTGAPDGTVALGRALAPGESVTVQLPVRTPINSDSGNKRLVHDLLLDLRNAGAWWSVANPPVPVSQSVRPARGCGITATGYLCVDRVVEDPTSDELGLEKFGTFTGEATGQGSQALVNLSSGNALWTHDLVANPSVGPSTFVRMTYNSNDVSDAGTGFGWSVQASTLTRLGSRLSVPKGNSTAREMSFIDGDGTTHYYRINDAASTSTKTVYHRPAGVHLDLRRDKTQPEATQWVFSRPDGTRFFYSQATGLPTSVVDLNDNTMTFTHDADGRLISLRDAKGRVTLTLGWEPKRGSNTGRLQWMRDISGRGITFSYTSTQQLAGIRDGGGFDSATGVFGGLQRTFGFTYATDPTNKHSRLVTVVDPRGATSAIAYRASGDGPAQSPNGQGWVKEITDRNGVATTFTYAGATDGPGVVGEVSDLNGALGTSGAVVTTYRTDGFGRTIMIRDANANAGVGGADQYTVTRLAWDSDHNVTRLTEPNGAVSTWQYNASTGYPEVVHDAEAVKDGTAGTVLTYRTLATPAAPTVLEKITTPKGNPTTFSHDAKGNLTGVTDPLGRPTTYVLNPDGTTARITDAKQNPTQLLDYDLSGQPKRVLDALNNATAFTYDVRGHLIQAVDALNNPPTIVEYDDYGRLRKVTTPHQGTGETRTNETVYDDNDNVTSEIAPTGATSTHTFSAMDEVRTSTLPPNSAAANTRTIAYDYDPFGRLLSETAPRGTATTDQNDFVTRYAYDRVGQVLRVEQPFTDGIDGAGTAKVATSTYVYDLVGNLTRVLDPNKVASPEDDYTATMTYDLIGQRTSVTDAAGYTSRTAYDRDGNVTASTDQDGHVTSYGYDAAGQLKTVTRTRAAQQLVTTFGYDDNGNQESVTRPSGKVEKIVFDALDRPSQTIGASDASGPYSEAPRTHLRYDAVGRLKRQSNRTHLQDPDAAGVEWTTFEYWPSGDVKSSTDPWGIQATHGYNKLGQQTSRTLSVAEAADPQGDRAERKMTWDFWPDGSLKTRSDAGAHPAQVADNAGPFQANASWTTATAVSQQGADVRVHAAGGTDTATWRLSPDVAGSYALRVTCPKVPGATTAATFTINVKDGASSTSSTATVDQMACQSGNVAPLLGNFTLTGGEDVTVVLTPSASGTTVADAVKLRKTDSSAQHRVFSYAYDANGQTTSVTDGAKTFTTAYDGLGRALKATETGGPSGARTTTWTYDLASNLLSSYAYRGAGDGSGAGNNEASRFTRYTFDLRDLVESVATGASPDATLKTTTFDYDPRGMRTSKTKPNGNVTTYDYYSDGLLQSLTERNPSGGVVASHDLTYHPDGDRQSDTSKLQNPDGDGFLDQMATYTYTPSRQLEKVTKAVPTGGSGEKGKDESYCYDAAGNVTEQKIGRTITRMAYDRLRLIETQTKTDDDATISCPPPDEDLAGAQSTLTHQYDAFGRATTVAYKAGAGKRAPGTVVKRYGYDGFDRVVREQTFMSNGTTNDTTTTRAYDAFDRTTSRTSTVRANPEVSTRFVYLGTTDQVAFEEQRNTDQAWQVAKAYTYGPGGEQLSLRDTGVNVPGPDVTESTDADKQLDAGESRDLFYGSNPHGDIETLTTGTGEVVSTYRYTAYGSEDPTGTLGLDAPVTETGEDAQPGDDPVTVPSATSVNPYRFNGKRHDPATASYDMGFRDYDPGLNRYTSRDMYNGALADMALGTDPWNTNRYAFAGGNPITGVELDGHYAAPASDGGGGTCDSKCQDSLPNYDSDNWNAGTKYELPAPVAGQGVPEPEPIGHGYKWVDMSTTRNSLTDNFQYWAALPDKQADPILEAQETIDTWSLAGVRDIIRPGMPLFGALLAGRAAPSAPTVTRSTPQLPPGYPSFAAAKKEMGSPGPGNVYDHVVEQSQVRRSGFALDEINSPFNMNPVPKGVNQIKANYYSRKLPFTNGGTVRDWLTGQSFEAQYRFGMQVLTDIRAGRIK